MKNKFLLAAFIPLAVSAVSNAQPFGDISEARRAAEESREPSYNKEIPLEYTKLLEAFVREEAIESPIQKQALFLTMNECLDWVDDFGDSRFELGLEGLLAAGNRLFDDGGDESNWCELPNAETAIDEFSNCAQFSAWAKALEIAERACYAGAAKKTINGYTLEWEELGDFRAEINLKAEVACYFCFAAMVGPKQLGATVFRTVQLHILRAFFSSDRNLGLFLLRFSYKEYLRLLSEDPKSALANPFADKEKWIRFRGEHFDGTEPGAREFLFAWIHTLNGLMGIADWTPRDNAYFRANDRAVARTIATLHFFGRAQKYRNLLGKLPKDLIRAFIIPFVMRGNAVLRLEQPGAQDSSEPAHKKLRPEAVPNYEGAADLRATLTQEVIAGAPLLDRAEIAARVDVMMGPATNEVAPMEIELSDEFLATGNDNNAPLTVEELLRQELNNFPNRFPFGWGGSTRQL